MSRHYSVQSDGDTIGCVHLPRVTPNVFASAAFVATAFWCTCKMSQCARTFFCLISILFRNATTVAVLARKFSAVRRATLQTCPIAFSSDQIAIPGRSENDVEKGKHSKVHSVQFHALRSDWVIRIVWVKFLGNHKTEFTIVALHQVCVPITHLFIHS